MKHVYHFEEEHKLQMFANRLFGKVSGTTKQAGVYH